MQCLYALLKYYNKVFCIESTLEVNWVNLTFVHVSKQLDLYQNDLVSKQPDTGLKHCTQSMDCLCPKAYRFQCSHKNVASAHCSITYVIFQTVDFIQALSDNLNVTQISLSSMHVGLFTLSTRNWKCNFGCVKSAVCGIYAVSSLGNVKHCLLAVSLSGGQKQTQWLMQLRPYLVNHYSSLTVSIHKLRFFCHYWHLSVLHSFLISCSCMYKI